MTAPNEVFVSYSHADTAWLERLQIHLAPLERDGVITLWDDTRIKPGERWRDEIREALERARAAILLVSADFLASPFIKENELPPLLSASANRGTLILPVIVSPCRFLQTASLACFQAVNSPDEPLVQMRRAKRETVFVRVSSRVEQAFAQGGTTDSSKPRSMSALQAVRQYVPIARYQTQFQRFMEVYTTVRPEICDGCTAAVEFRPIAKITLPAADGLPTVKEQLCPRCARERGIKLSVPKDMDQETMYAVGNPSYANHIHRILKFPVLASLSQNSELRERGIVHVGAGYSHSHPQITLYVTHTDSSTLEVATSIYELQGNDVRSDSDLFEFCKSMIVARLNNSGL